MLIYSEYIQVKCQVEKVILLRKLEKLDVSSENDFKNSIELNDWINKVVPLLRIVDEECYFNFKMQAEKMNLPLSTIH